MGHQRREREQEEQALKIRAIQQNTNRRCANQARQGGIFLAKILQSWKTKSRERKISKSKIIKQNTQPGNHLPTYPQTQTENHTETQETKK